MSLTPETFWRNLGCGRLQRQGRQRRLRYPLVSSQLRRLVRGRRDPVDHWDQLVLVAQLHRLLPLHLLAPQDQSVLVARSDSTSCSYSPPDAVRTSRRRSLHGSCPQSCNNRGSPRSEPGIDSYAARPLITMVAARTHTVPIAEPVRTVVASGFVLFDISTS
jgi:hypothetical protein